MDEPLVDRLFQLALDYDAEADANDPIAPKNWRAI